MGAASFARQRFAGIGHDWQVFRRQLIVPKEFHQPTPLVGMSRKQPNDNSWKLASFSIG